MKPHRKACSLTAAILTFGSLVGGANAALSLTVNEATSNKLSISISGTFTTDTIGAPIYKVNFGIKPDWVGNQGTHQEWINDAYNGSFFVDSGSPTSTISVTQNTITVGGSNGNSIDSAFIVANSGSLADTLIWSTELDIKAGDSITGTLVLEGAGAFDFTSMNELQLLSGGQGYSGNLDYARLEDSFTINAVPEPSSAALLGLGCLSLAFRRTRR